MLVHKMLGKGREWAMEKRIHENRRVLLVGSIPLASAREVFEMIGESLGHLVSRIPDGETGARSNWIGWQAARLAALPALERIEYPDRYGTVRAKYSLKEGARFADLSLASLGYADVAVASYQAFSDLRASGRLPAACRFQVCLPTPLAIVTSYVESGDQPAMERIVEDAILSDLQRILAEIPHRDLAIQWDVAIEFAILEGVMPSHLASPLQGIVQRLARFASQLPVDVELGFHLCYGDAGHKHFTEPRDTARMVELANALAAAIPRTVHWIHMPVPRQRTDPAYFAPMRDLHTRAETEIYLGLVHLTDGVAGTTRRIKAAEQGFGGVFGVATECGFGRRSPATMPSLLALHRRAASI
jgi:hypothetical protein